MNQSEYKEIQIAILSKAGVRLAIRLLQVNLKTTNDFIEEFAQLLSIPKNRMREKVRFDGVTRDEARKIVRYLEQHDIKMSVYQIYPTKRILEINGFDLDRSVGGKCGRVQNKS